MAKILIVDDDRSLTHITKAVLTYEGYEVVIANSATKAMEEIEKAKPDLILMDVMMPEISGADAVRMLQKKHDLKNIPVIFLTGLLSHSEGDLEEKGININGKSYLTIGKPFEISHLLEAIKNHIKN